MGPDDVAILGTSTTGVALGFACAKVGMNVAICEPDAHARDRATVFTQRESAEIAGRISFCDDYVPAERAAFLFDAREPNNGAAVSISPDPEAVVATPFAQAPAFGHPSQRVRFVPFQPMYLRHLTELTAFSETAEFAYGVAKSVAERIGRVPVVLPLGSGSVGLRLLDRMHDTADQLLLEGAVLWELDEALSGFGFDLGFYEAQDLMGLDVAYARRKARNAPSLIADRAVEEGRLGKKIGWGWYRYPGGGGAVVDPLIDDLIREEAWFAKIEQRTFSTTQMLEPLLEKLGTETQTILVEEQVSTAADLSRILVHGLGFPKAQLDTLCLPPLND